MNWLYIHCILYSISVNNRYKLRYTKTNHYDDKVLHFIATISSLFPCAVGWVIYSWNMTVETIAKGILHVTSDNVIVSMRNCKLLWNFIIMQKHLPCRGLNLYDLVVYHSMKQWATISFMAWLLADNTTPKVYVASTQKHSFLFIADENELDLPCENVFSSLPNHNCMHASVSWYNDCKFCNEDHSNDTTIHDNDNNVIDNGMMMTMIMMATIMAMIMFIFTKYWWVYWYMIIHILIGCPWEATATLILIFKLLFRWLNIDRQFKGITHFHNRHSLKHTSKKSPGNQYLSQKMDKNYNLDQHFYRHRQSFIYKK